MQASPEGHARVERHDDVAGHRVVLAPGRPDDDATADPQDREVLLPGRRPVLLVDDTDLELADGPQAERREVAEAHPRLRDGGLGSATVVGRQVGAHGHRGARDEDRRQTFRLGREGLLHRDAGAGHA